MGLAFGTGRHPTTRLCLEWLAARPLNGRRVLDYGCGSGVLALAALVLGAESALAVDVEPQALQATRDNARLNGLETRIWLGAPHELAPIQADIVLANIIARSLEALAPELSTRVVPGGRLVLSGLLETQVDAVRDAYAPAFRDFAVATAAGWALLEATRARQ
jgi:ribosomal protein L11 methyltransferase